MVRACGILIGASRNIETMSLTRRLPLLLWLLLLPSLPVTADEVQPFRDPDTGLMSWRVQQPGFSLQLVRISIGRVALFTRRSAGGTSTTRMSVV